MIAERLMQLRQAAGLTQDTVAQDLHMTRSAYSSYENRRRLPPADALLLLARYYRTTADYLLGISDDPGPPPVLDERGKALIRLYQTVDDRGRDTIYRMALHEKMQYGHGREEEGRF